jgi:galactose oxidase-like protein
MGAKRKLNQQDSKKRTSMKTQSTSRLTFLNPRGLIGFALYAAGLVLAFGVMSSAAAGDNADADLSQSIPARLPGRWQVTGSMATARQEHTATLLPNGQVLVAGGLSWSARGLRRAELYDPASGVWTTGNMTDQCFEHTATLLPNGEVLVAGGGTASAELYESAPEALDIE